MTVSCTGAEFLSFYHDKDVWAGERWYDDARIVVNGAVTTENWEPEDLDPLDKVEVSGGEFYRGPHISSPFDGFELALQDWLKGRKCKVVGVEIDLDKLDSALASLAGIPGVRVIS